MRIVDEPKEVKILWKETYLQMIRNSCGMKTVRNFYAEANGRKEDILRNGDLSCAIYVSAILVLMGLLPSLRSTVSGLEKSLLKSGWKKIKRVRSGAVIIWEKKWGDDKKWHRHSGFVLDSKIAVSNNPKKGYPLKHHLTFGKDKKGQPNRKIEAIYIHPNIQ
jgi:hypothetical protein